MRLGLEFIVLTRRLYLSRTESAKHTVYSSIADVIVRKREVD